MKKFTVACVAFASVMGFVATASAQDLGEEGQLAISSDLQLSFTSTSTKAAAEGAEDPDSTTSITIQPAVDYFLMDSLSLGGAIGYQSTSQGDVKSSGILIGPRVGYAIPVGEGMAFWPKLGITYQTMSMDDGTNDMSGNKMSLDVFAPLAIQPAENFFVGIGPVVSMDLSSKIEDEDADKDTTIGITTQVGGYF